MEWIALDLIPVVRKDLGAKVRQFHKIFKTTSFKHEPTQLTAFIGTFLALGGLQLAQVAAANALPESTSMVLIGSSAALTTLLFAAPAAPLGTPWNTFLGHLVSISVALCFHWLELLTGINLLAVVMVPSLAIALMVRYKAVNPPAAAAAFIFTTTPKAHAQALGGAFFLMMPALVSCAWLMLCQFALAEGLAWIKKRGGAELPLVPAPKPSVVVSAVDPAVASCIIQAVEGAAYVDDPLLFLMQTLAEDRARLQRQRAVLRALGVRSSDKPSHAATVIQTRIRKLLALRRLTPNAASKQRKSNGFAMV